MRRKKLKRVFAETLGLVRGLLIGRDLLSSQVREQAKHRGSFLASHAAVSGSNLAKMISNMSF